MDVKAHPCMIIPFISYDCPTNILWLSDSPDTWRNHRNHISFLKARVGRFAVLRRASATKVCARAPVRTSKRWWSPVVKRFVASTISGWWLSLPLWKMMEWVTVGMILRNIWKNKSHVPNHQPAKFTNFDDLIWIPLMSQFKDIKAPSGISATILGANISINGFFHGFVCLFFYIICWWFNADNNGILKHTYITENNRKY